MSNEFHEGIPDANAMGNSGEDDFDLDDDLSPLQRITKLSTFEIERYRIMAVKEIASLADVVPHKEITQSLLPFLRDLVLDQEAVVRQAVAENMTSVSLSFLHHLTPSLSSSSPSPHSASPSSPPLTPPLPAMEGKKESDEKAAEEKPLPKASLPLSPVLSPVQASSLSPSLSMKDGVEFLIDMMQLCEKLLSDLDTQVRETAADSFVSLCALVRIHTTPLPPSPPSFSLNDSPPSPSLSSLSLAPPLSPSSSASSSPLQLSNSFSSSVLKPSLSPALPLSLPPSLYRALTASLCYPLPPYGAQIFEDNCVPVVHRFGNANAEMEDQAIGAIILDKCAAIFGREILSEMLPLIVSLSQNATFRVRQTIAGALGVFAEVLGEKQTEQDLLPLFNTLSNDKIWRVRKECVAATLSLSRVLPVELSKSFLLVRYEQFVDDASRWVRTAAYQNIGPFIATFKGEEIDDDFLILFTEMISPKMKSKVGDPFISECCSFSFPGVFQTIGKDRWEQIQECYHNLVKDPQWKVRRSLSYSIHDIAQIAGSEITKNELLECWKTFFTDLDLVKSGVIKNLAPFVEVLPADMREEEFKLALETIENEQENWRFRKYLARQLARLSSLIPTLVESFFLPCALRLSFDPVAEVRKYAVTQFGLMIPLLDDKSIKEFTTTLMSKSSAPSTFYERQIFVDVCGSMIDQVNVQFFENTFMNTFFSLASDPVPNVRLLVAAILAKKMNRHSKWSAHQKKVTELLNQLKMDKDGDVVAAAAQ